MREKRLLCVLMLLDCYKCRLVYQATAESGGGMSYLQKILLEVKSGLSACEAMPESRWAMIASMCGPAELEELHERNSRLKSDLLVVEDWDGDTGMRLTE